MTRFFIIFLFRKQYNVEDDKKSGIRKRQLLQMLLVIEQLLVICSGGLQKVGGKCRIGKMRMIGCEWHIVSCHDTTRKPSTT